MPDGWSEATIGKVEKAYNGTDTKWLDPQGKSQAYVVTYSGYTELKNDRRSMLDDLALSDASLQDALQSSDASVSVSESSGGGPRRTVYFDVDAPTERSLAAVTVDEERLYALFVRSRPSTFSRDADTFRRIQSSFRVLT